MDTGKNELSYDFCKKLLAAEFVDEVIKNTNLVENPMYKLLVSEAEKEHEEAALNRRVINKSETELRKHLPGRYLLWKNY